MRIRQYILIFLVITIIGFSLLSCLKSSSGKVFPFLPNQIFTESNQRTADDVGLYSVSGTSTSGEQIVLPAISENERSAIEASLKQMNDLGMMNTSFWEESSRKGREVLSFQPLSNSQMNDKIMANLKGESYSEPTPPSDTYILERETRAADNYFSKVEESFPNLTVVQLIAIRTSLTLSLVTIRMQLDYNDKSLGLPDTMFLMVRKKTVESREKVSKELINRGVKSI
jgi:hypothetical protein